MEKDIIEKDIITIIKNNGEDLEKLRTSIIKLINDCGKENPGVDLFSAIGVLQVVMFDCYRTATERGNI